MLGLLLFYKLYILLRETMIDHLIILIFAVRPWVTFGASGLRRVFTSLSHAVCLSSLHNDDGDNTSKSYRMMSVRVCGQIRDDGWLHYDPGN